MRASRLRHWGLSRAFPPPAAADFLYAVWTKTRGRSDATRLAEQLVYTKEVRRNASPALEVALKLRKEEDCEALKGAALRAAEVGESSSSAPPSAVDSSTGLWRRQGARLFFMPQKTRRALAGA